MDNEVLYLDEKKLTEIIINHYSTNGENVRVEKDLKIIDNDLSLNIYLIKDDKRYILTHEDLEYIFKFYIHGFGFEYVDFKFIGFIRHVGYFVDAETPIFQGVQIMYLDKTKIKKKIL